MSDLSGFPYHEIQFTRDGAVNDENEVAALLTALDQESPTDLVVISHGWNNDMPDARALYAGLFASARAVIDDGRVPDLSDRRFMVLGILWPSKKFAPAEVIASGAAGIGPAIPDSQIIAALDTLGAALDDPGAKAGLTRAKRLVPRLQDDAKARQQFADTVRQLLRPDAANDEDASSSFFRLPGGPLMDRLSKPVNPAAPRPRTQTGGAAALGIGGGLRPPTALVGSIVSGARAAALRLANYSTYYLMKQRAGTVGQIGVVPVLRRVRERKPGLKIHLVGHSFGGRLVSAVAASCADSPKLQANSLTLLQAAFSHNGFARKFDGTRDGFFRRAVDDQTIAGPILITHTPNDKAVGGLYPLASLLAGDDAAGIGDANDPFGGIGRNGAQHTPEAVALTLLGVDEASYDFQAGKLHNLEASTFISDHGDIVGQEVARALLTAVSMT